MFGSDGYQTDTVGYLNLLIYKFDMKTHTHVLIVCVFEIH